MKKLWVIFGHILTIFLYVPAMFLLPRSNRVRVLVIVNNKLLLVKNWLGFRRYGLPGGGVKKHEDAKLSAMRELFEETTIVIKPDQLTDLGCFHQTKGLKFPYQLYVCELERQPKLSKLPLFGEITELRWMDIGKLNKFGVEQHVTDSLAVYNVSGK
jgi:8-oxo-dGTP pyrophosphatase MutT (NUDIX family)